jgi:bifunctional non-homologous end joining protein LigD
MTRKTRKAGNARTVFVEPMAVLLVEALPDEPGWIFEPKLDGYRAVIIKDGPRVLVRSRNDNDFASTYPTVTGAAATVEAERAVIDGEIVALDANGRPSFQALQHRGTRPDHTIAYYAFDLLQVDGEELLARPLAERRARLAEVIRGSELLLSPALPGSANEVATAVKAIGLEGVVAKRADSPYEPGERSGAWVKVKFELQQEFVVGGYRPNNRSIDALLVGYYEGSTLRFAGKVRAGFVAHTRRQVFEQLEPLTVARCPFPELPTGRSRWGGGVTADEMQEMRWTSPEAVAQIAFVEWTAEGRLRHAKFLGMRTDRIAQAVTREQPSTAVENIERPKPAAKPKRRRKA